MWRIIGVIGCLMSIGGGLPLAAQHLTGVWKGTLWQHEGTDTFAYELTLQQDGPAVSGEAVSTAADGVSQARFLLSGKWDGSLLVLQEVEQLSPNTPSWCLKYLTLQLQSTSLIGNWTAKGCRPGAVALYKEGSPLPFSYAGRWTGHLSQSDRDYGFYYEWILAADGTGTSRIVSEEAGGEATHDLLWQPTEHGIRFEETGVRQKSVAQWKWCIKSGELALATSPVDHAISGNWGGFLEHKTRANGACAPGKVQLFRPIPHYTTPNTVNALPPTQQPYIAETGRSVKIDRVLQVKSNRIRIRVWDNGVVDGDVLTLF
ncbi:MAG: hypothetical protein R2795_23115, partial [Saprospiraceae bacterium]